MVDDSDDDEAEGANPPNLSPIFVDSNSKRIVILHDPVIGTLFTTERCNIVAFALPCLCNKMILAFVVATEVIRFIVGR